jgi:hypothetical protein
MNIGALMSTSLNSLNNFFSNIPPSENLASFVEHMVTELNEKWNNSIVLPEIDSTLETINQLKNSIIKKFEGSVHSDTKVSKLKLFNVFYLAKFTPQEVVAVANLFRAPNLFKEYALHFCKLYHEGPFDNLFYERFDSNSLKDFLFLIKAGYPINEEVLTSIFNSRNYLCIETFFKNADYTMLEQQANMILNLMRQVEDPAINQIVTRYFPRISLFCSLHLLSKAVENRQVCFVNSILSSPTSFDKKEVETLMDIAIERYNLPIIRSLCKCCNVNYIEIVSSKFFPISNSNELHCENLIKLAIMSPLSDIYELICACPFLKKNLDKTLEVISLLARFPNSSFAEYAIGGGGYEEDVNEYLKKSISYAKSNRNFINEFAPKLEKTTRDHLLDEIIEKRNLRSLYKIKQIDSPTKSHTNLFFVNSERNPRAVQSFSYFKPEMIESRYAWALRHLSKLEEIQKNPLNVPSSLMKFEKGMLKYYYSYLDHEKKASEVLLTTLGNYGECRSRKYSVWLHTDISTTEKLQEHLEMLQSEIIHFDLNLSNPESKKAFFEKVATGYWLIATLCETHRGTPHNAMMWLNFIYNHHHLPPPIPKIEHFFLDNTMLVFPVDYVVENWESFFEPSYEEFLNQQSKPS